MLGCLPDCHVRIPPGNAFYWYLRSEVHAPEISERYSLILEAYLRGSPSHRRRLHRQNQALNAIYHVGTKIKVSPTQWETVLKTPIMA
jgi:hypothetical protein